MGILLTASVTAVRTHPVWTVTSLLLWAGYTAGLFVITKVGKNGRWGVTSGSFLSILFILSLYLILSKLVFDVIPWDGDPLLYTLDHAIFFGHSPVLFLSRLASPGVVEIFSVIYGVFIPYLYFSIFLCLLGRAPSERTVFVTAFTLTYAISFLGYLMVPARGPVVFMESEFGRELCGGFFHGLVLNAIENAGGPHGAFPSLHIGATWFICFYELRRGQLRGLLHLPLVIGIFFATMLLRYHYFIDLVAGFAIATFSVIQAERIHGMYRPSMSLFSRACRFFIGHFFSGIQANGIENLPAPGTPVILVSNHTNAFVDPFAIAAAIGRPLKITAKASLWKNPIIAISAGFSGIIPLARASDNQDKDPRAQNRMAFRHCIKRLDKGDMICFFPEGKSHSDPGMMPFKTGAARLAIEYVSSGKKGRHLDIVPVGLFYTGKSLPGSRVVVEVGEPLNVSTWMNRTEACDHRTLTKKLEDDINALTVQAEDKEDATLFVWLSEVIQRFKKIPVSVDNVSRVPSGLVRTAKQMLETYYLHSHSPEVTRIMQDTRDLKKEQEHLGISTENLFLPISFWKALFFAFREAEVLVLGALIFLVAAIVNGVPFALLFWLVRVTSKDEDHFATNYLFYGAGIFSLWYLGMGTAAALINGWLILWIPLALYCTCFAPRYMFRLKRTLTRMGTFWLFLRNPGLQADLIEKQQHLVSQLGEFQKNEKGNINDI